jgi:hypothetical protein
LDQLVHLQYSINNDVIQLKNTASEGNYSLVLKVKATDPVGNVAEGSKYITFEGNVVEFGGGYDEYVAECYAEGKAFWHKISTKYAPSAQFVPRWVPVNFPPSEKLLEMLYVLASSPAPEAQAVLPQTVTAHRSSFLRVLSDLKAGKIGFMKGKIVAK